MRASAGRKILSTSTSRHVPGIRRTRLGCEPLEARHLLAAFPVPLTPVAPLGAQAYEGIASSTVAPGVGVSYTINLDAGLLVTLVGTPTGSSIDLQLTLRNPSGGIVGTANSVGLGRGEILQSSIPTIAGVYTVEVTSVSGSGSFDVTLRVGAAQEVEEIQLTSNDTQGEAQNLDPAFDSFGVSFADRAVVTGNLGSLVGTPFIGDGFESGSLGSDWSTFSSAPSGRIQVSGSSGTGNGNFALLMDQSPNGTLQLNEAEWRVDLSAAPQPVTLSFLHASFRDEATAFAGTFTGHYNADGVAISDDGITWRPLWSAPLQPDSVWVQSTFDLSSAAQTAGLGLGPNFRIRLQQYDNLSLPSDGRGWDDVQISTPAPAFDWYRFTAFAGQSVSVLVDSFDDNANLGLYNSAGTLLALGTPDAATATERIENFIAPASGIYNVRLTSAATDDNDYTLVITRGAQFAEEPNNDIGAPQQITAGAVLSYAVTPVGDAFNTPLGKDVPRGGAATFGVQVPEQHQPGQPLSLRDSVETLPAPVESPNGSDADDGPDPQSGGSVDLFESTSGPIPLNISFAGPRQGNVVPPDPTLATGPEQVVAVVNTRIGVYDKRDGTPLYDVGISGTGGFFGSVGATTTVFDPHAVYDYDSQRFFVLAIDVTSNHSFAYVAVSQDSTPTTASEWHKYKIDFTHFPQASLGSGAHFPDYPKIAVDQDALWVSGNYFPISSGGGVYAGITAIDKASLLVGGPADKVYENFFDAFSVYPLNTYGDAPAQYFVETSTFGGSSIAVYAVSNVLTTPQFSSATVAVPGFNFPNDVPQLGGATPADSIDNRIMGGVWRNGSIWATHAASDPTIGDNEAVARWYEIATNSFPLAAPTLVQAGNVDPGPGIHAFMPNIAVDGHGSMGIGFSTGGTNQFLGAGYTGRLATDPPGTTALPTSNLVSGQATYSVTDSFGRNRWGDYTGISIDPADDLTFWVLNEYPRAGNAWYTQIGSFQLIVPEDDEWFRVSATAGVPLDLLTLTPGGGTGEFLNQLDPRLELFDPNGTPVASDDNSAGDFRNARILHTPTQTGLYSVRLSGALDRGDIVLQVTGAASTGPGPTVLDADPDAGQSVNSFPLTYTLDFSEGILLSSVQAGDLLVGGLPALSVTAIDGDTLEFTVNPSAAVGDGNYAVVLPAGALSDLQGTGNSAFGTTFVLDTVGPRISSTTWNGQSLPASRQIAPGPLTLVTVLDEDLFAIGTPRRGLFTPGSDDIILINTATLQRIDVTQVDYDPNTDRVTMTFPTLVVGPYELRLVSSTTGFQDLVGNPLDGDPLGANPDFTPTGDGSPGGDYVIAFSVGADATPPGVSDITLRSTTSAHTPYSVPVGSGEQLRTVPMANLDVVEIAFGEFVDVDAADLTVTGMATANYPVVSFSFNATTFVGTWTLSQPIVADRVTLRLNADGTDPIADAAGNRLDGEWDNPTSLADPTSDTFPAGNGSPGGDFLFQLTGLAGDANRDNQVTGADFTIWADNFGVPQGGGSFGQGDFNGDGFVTGADFTIWADQFGLSFPTPQAAAPVHTLTSEHDDALVAPRVRVIASDAVWSEFGQIRSARNERVARRAAPCRVADGVVREPVPSETWATRLVSRGI